MQGTALPFDVDDTVAAAEPAASSTAAFIEFLAVGGATLLLFPLSFLLRAAFGLDEAELAVGATMFYAAHVINDPHFSVTYLLFYDDVKARALGRGANAFHGAQRVRYVFCGLIVPAVLIAWAGAALAMRSAQALGWMIQLMFLLVGWHYIKQGFGVLTVLSARRGVRFSATERNVILTHGYAAAVFAWANPSTLASKLEEKGVVYWAPAHPRLVELLTGAVLALSTLALAFVLHAKWRREGSLPFTPLFGFVITIWVWTIFTQLDPLVRYTLPALHSLQYAYFVWLMKRNRARAEEAPPMFGKPIAARLTALLLSALVLGWLLLRGGPALLDANVSLSNHASSALGATPFFAACFVIVNIHHYFMDAVLWRRENPETRFLFEP